MTWAVRSNCRGAAIRRRLDPGEAKRLVMGEWQLGYPKQSRGDEPHSKMVPAAARDITK